MVKIFEFWLKFWFLVNQKISIFDQNFHFWPKFPFLTKISIFDQNFNFQSKFQFLTKLSIFDLHFDFWPKFLINIWCLPCSSILNKLCHRKYMPESALLILTMCAFGYFHGYLIPWDLINLTCGKLMGEWNLPILPFLVIFFWLIFTVGNFNILQLSTAYLRKTFLLLLIFSFFYVFSNVFLGFFSFFFASFLLPFFYF